MTLRLLAKVPIGCIVGNRSQAVYIRDGCMVALDHIEGTVVHLDRSIVVYYNNQRDIRHDICICLREDEEKEEGEAFFLAKFISRRNFEILNVLFHDGQVMACES